VVVAKLILITLFLVVAYATLPTWHGLTGESATAARAAAVAADDVKAELSDWGFVLVFANALTWISLSYSGFNAAVYMTDEIKHPRRNVPRAMVLGTALVTVLYLLLNAVFVYAPPPSVVAGQPNVATLAAESVGDQLQARGWQWGPWVGQIVRVAILAGLATSVLALMQTGPRVYQKMAIDRLLPQVLIGRRGRSSTGQTAVTGSSLPAIWLQATLAVVVICSASLREQLDYLGFTLSVCAAICGGLVFFFRNHSQRPVRVWGYPWVPSIYVFGTLLIATLTAIRVPLQAVVGLITLGIGIMAYSVARSRWGSRIMADRRN
jgi:APA family basic amino acid/polyamine antiporter